MRWCYGQARDRLYESTLIEKMVAVCDHSREHDQAVEQTGGLRQLNGYGPKPTYIPVSGNQPGQHNTMKDWDVAIAIMVRRAGCFRLPWPFPKTDKRRAAGGTILRQPEAKSERRESQLPGDCR